MILPIENNAPTLIRRVPILLFFLILILSAPAPNGYAAAIPSDLRAIHVLNRLAFGPSPGDNGRERQGWKSLRAMARTIRE